jgi:hypothetical protein
MQWDSEATNQWHSSEVGQWGEGQGGSGFTNEMSVLRGLSRPLKGLSTEICLAESGIYQYIFL